MEFNPFRNKTYNCFQNNIVSIIKHYFTRNYLPIFWSNFDFKYHYPENINIDFDDILIDGCNDSNKDILRDICGISISEHNNYSYKEFEEILHDKLLRNEPVGIGIDSPNQKYYSENR